MNPADVARIEQFVTRWQTSSGSERANYQMFFTELCDALGVERPNVNGSGATVPYCFDKHITIYHPSGKKTPGYIDFYKADHFLIEAKQGSDRAGKGTAKRGTTAYLKAMEAAFVQAIAYTRNLSSKPPFLLTCDIGDHFELWLGFNGDYGGYGARRDLALTDLRQPEIFDLFVDIFTDPQKRNPEKIAAKVTRAVAADLADLAKTLERSPHPQSLSRGEREANLAPFLLGEKGVGDEGTEGRPQQVAHFLMRCIFTMFAEDVGLLKEHLFTEALETRWLLNPKSFKPEVESLWQAMNDGTAFGFYGRLLKFNGGLFAEAIAFELDAEQLGVLLTAAKREWKDVEPAIFGTLLERALDTKERSKLGAHYTPRSYVERLVRPVVMEPLREQWDLVQGEVKQILGDGESEPTAAQKKKAIAALESFLAELRGVRVLDPACGSGNFLYVTLDLIKQLESEVLRRLEDVTGQAQLRLDIDQVNPSQFLGIELNPRAAAIADLVIWIGYLQWHFRRFGDIPPVEPVLREYHNIECRDAVLAYDGKVEDIDPKTGKVRSRWGGRMRSHAVTGEQVPDPSDQIPIYRYINPRPAEWLPRLPSPLAPLPAGEGNENAAWLPSPLGSRVGDDGISKLAGRTRQIPKALLQRAQELRQQQTPVEKLLWECLRDRRLHNAKFRRQHNLGQFIADFYCHEAHLVIELDGEIHQQQQQRDRDRDHWMQANGFTVLRFRNEEVLSNTEAVLETIAQSLPSPLAPLPAGEGNSGLPSPLGRRVGDEGQVYIVSNPPFIGNARMRDRLGDGYTETLRQVYSDVPETVDFVMYWWHKAAELARENQITRFGFITTNSIHQVRQRKVIEFHQNQKDPIRLIFAIADHPWVEDEGAAVRIAMTVGQADASNILRVAQLGTVVQEVEAATPEDSAERVEIYWKSSGQILSNLRSGADVTKTKILKSNQNLVSRGVMPGSEGFQVEQKNVALVEASLLKKYLNGRDLLQTSRNILIIDTSNLTEESLRVKYPKTYQYLLERVKPERLTNNDLKLRSEWWLYRRANTILRSALQDLQRYIATVETSKHRIFTFLEKDVLPDNKLVIIALDDAYFLGILSSKIHVTWALASGSRLEDRPVYAKTTCFDPFPFPNPTPGQKQKIRELGDRLDSHRKRVQAQHPDVTITAMYNLLEKIRAGVELTEGDRAFNNKALVSTLKQIHDELDTAVFEAYGWEDLNLPSPLAPLPTGEGNSGLPSPRGRRAGDEGLSTSIDDSRLPFPSAGLPSPSGRRAGDEGLSTNIDETILERLVALNSDRAEEERNGLIRWLRPEYQAPGEVQTQQVIDGMAEVEVEAIAPVEQQKFPKIFKDQLAVVRDLLRTQGGEWTVEQIAAQFKGASRQKATILTCLESLEALGIIARHAEDSSDRWYLAELQKVS
jgi:very-short-patch-repair endonuclease